MLHKLPLIPLLFCLFSPQSFAEITQQELIQLQEKANLGNSEDEFRLADSYLAESSIRNEEEAFYWFSRAAEQGHQQAQLQTADMLVKGQGTQKDINAAALWYTQLAIEGNSHAAYKLGELYELETESFDALDQAELWYRLASSQLPQAQQAYERVLQAQFNKRRSEQVSSFKALDEQYSEQTTTQAPASSIVTTTLPSQATLQSDQENKVSQNIIIGLAIVIMLLIGFSGFLIAKLRKGAQTKTEDISREQIKLKDIQLSQQKHQIATLYKELKKRQNSKSNHNLQLACAVFGYKSSAIPEQKQIKIRYKQLSKIYHPDGQGSDEEMKRLNAALKTILQNVTKT
jgi:hypothetical protein